MRSRVSPCPDPLASPRASEASGDRLPTCDPSRALAAAPTVESQPEPASARTEDSGRRGGRKEEARAGSGWKVAIGARKEGGSQPEGGRRQRVQGAAGGSQLSTRPATATACRGAAGRDGLVRGRPLLLPRSAAPPALRAPPTGEWPRHAGRERGRASALCVTARGPGLGRAPGGAELLGVASIGHGGSQRLGPRLAASLPGHGELGGS